MKFPMMSGKRGKEPRQKAVSSKMNKVKVIFLDVDGVLNGFHTRRRTKNGCTFVDRVQHAIEMLAAMDTDISDEERRECEEHNVKGYWLPTRANAIKPLYHLLAFAQLRPDGVWSGD